MDGPRCRCRRSADACAPTGSSRLSRAAGARKRTKIEQRSDGDELDLDVADFGVQAGRLYEVDDLAQDFVRMPRVVAEAGDAQRGDVPVVLRIDLGDGDVEAI